MRRLYDLIRRTFRTSADVATLERMRRRFEKCPLTGQYWRFSPVPTIGGILYQVDDVIPATPHMPPIVIMRHVFTGATLWILYRDEATWLEAGWELLQAKSAGGRTERIL